MRLRLMPNLSASEGALALQLLLLRLRSIKIMRYRLERPSRTSCRTHRYARPQRLRSLVALSVLIVRTRVQVSSKHAELLHTLDRAVHIHDLRRQRPYPLVTCLASASHSDCKWLLLVLARSNNGTFVNNIKVGSDPVELRDKARIRFFLVLVLAMVVGSGCRGEIQGYGRACWQNWHGAL